MGYISIATKDDRLSLCDLRRREYERSRSFDVLDPESIDWLSGDDRSLVLIARADETRTIATMRGQFFWSMEETEGMVESEFNSCNLSWPAMALSRAATDINFQMSGLNSVLRFHFFSFAVSWGVSHIVGAVYRDSPRTHLMEKLGYRLFPSPDLAPGKFKAPLGKHLSAVIDLRKDGEKALSVLHTLTAASRLQYPWRGVYPMRPW